MTTDEIDALSAWATVGAALATILSAAFIAWQIFLTRQSMEATREALDIAREEFAHGQVLREDAQRAAIDAEMPRLSVAVWHQSNTVRRMDVLVPDPFTFAPDGAELAAGTTFALPADGDIPLQVQVTIGVSNDGPRRARLRVGNQELSSTPEIVVGATNSFVLRRILTLREWVEIARARESGTSGDEAVIAEVVYLSPGDVGADEHHVVLQGGSVVERVTGTQDLWRVAQLENPNPPHILNSLHADPQPFVRTYWASRREGRLLGRDAEH